jgi:hypothetical protein
MVQLTERAAMELKALKEANGMAPTEGIKLVRDGERIGVVAGEPIAGDEVIRRDAEPLLIVAPELAESLRELTFDCVDVEEHGEVQQRFTLRAA